VPLDVPSLAWQPQGLWWALALELVLSVPFLCAGLLTGMALTDQPQRLAGHYAATLAGSGLGAPLAVLLMFVLSPARLILVGAGVGLVAAACLVPWGHRRRALWALPAAAVLLALRTAPTDVPLSQYKALPLLEAMPGTSLLLRRESPMGRLDGVTGPAIHHTPGLGLQYAGTVPEHALLLVDGEPLGAVYRCPTAADWQFMDHTTLAAPYHLRPQPSVLILGVGGGSDIGLAQYHGSRRVTGLDMNVDVLGALVTGPLADHGRSFCEAQGVDLVCTEARSFLATRGGSFELIQLPLADALGATGAGLYAGRESSLYTVEAFGLMLERLTPTGILAVTRWAQTPPREGLRVFDTAAQALRARGLPPATHLAMLRNWATVTVLAFRQPVSEDEARRLRQFCQERGFDLCYLPDMRPEEANRYHALARPYDYEGALALVGAGRAAFLGQYPFAVTAATDDRPYFHHFLRWRGLPGLVRQTGARSRAFVEMGYLLALATLVQSVLVAGALILLPLGVRRGHREAVRGEAAVALYFLFVGGGFMLLEMSMFQQFIRYLGQPVFSAATVVASFLVFGGVGSLWSRHWQARPARAAGRATALVAAMALAAVVTLPGWLRFAQGLPMPMRIATTVLTIAPLALAMGHCFPLGLLAVAGRTPALIPWLWGVNGFASVVATAAAPLLAMACGLRSLGWLAAGCYGVAAVCAWRWPGQGNARERPDRSNGSDQSDQSDRSDGSPRSPRRPGLARDAAPGSRPHRLLTHRRIVDKHVRDTIRLAQEDLPEGPCAQAADGVRVPVLGEGAAHQA
jgi:spermidine synthase